MATLWEQITQNLGGNFSTGPSLETNQPSGSAAFDYVSPAQGGQSAVQTGGEGGQEFSQQDYINPPAPQYQLQGGTMNPVNVDIGLNTPQYNAMDNYTPFDYQSSPDFEPIAQSNVFGGLASTTGHYAGENYNILQQRRANTAAGYGYGTRNIEAYNPLGGTTAQGHDNQSDDFYSQYNVIESSVGGNIYQRFEEPSTPEEQDFINDMYGRFGGGYGFDATEYRGRNMLHGGQTDVWMGDVMSWFHQQVKNNPSFAQQFMAGFDTSTIDPMTGTYAIDWNNDAIWREYLRYESGKPDTADTTYNPGANAPLMDIGAALGMQSIDMTGGLDTSQGISNFGSLGQFNQGKWPDAVIDPIEPEPMPNFDPIFEEEESYGGYNF